MVTAGMQTVSGARGGIKGRRGLPGGGAAMHSGPPGAAGRGKGLAPMPLAYSNSLCSTVHIPRLAG